MTELLKNPLVIAFAIPVGYVILYAAIRIVGAAWYKSKRQFGNH